MWTNDKLKLGLILAKKIDNYLDCSRNMIKQKKLKTKFWPYEGHLSAKIKRRKRKTWNTFQEPRNKREIKKARKFKEITWLFWVSSHIKGKIMNLECFSIMFDTSFACYDKLGQGLWVIKAW